MIIDTNRKSRRKVLEKKRRSKNVKLYHKNAVSSKISIRRLGR